MSNMNIGLHEGMKALALQGGRLYRKHIYVAPAPRTGNSIVTPTLKQLRALAEEGCESSLAERSAHWRTKLRAEPGGGGHPLQGPNAALEDLCGDVRLLWCGLRCERPICSFAQDQGAKAVAQQQKQPQGLPPRPPPSQPPQ